MKHLKGLCKTEIWEIEKKNISIRNVNNVLVNIYSISSNFVVKKKCCHNF